jgi:predicted membrane metal-binding protein
MIVANSATALMYLFGAAAIRQALPGIPGWAFPVLIVMSLFNLVCAIALFQWKKWGFWGFCASSVIALAVNLSVGIGIGQSLAGLVGLLILYGVLQIGKENKGWPQLE